MACCESLMCFMDKHDCLYRANVLFPPHFAYIHYFLKHFTGVFSSATVQLLLEPILGPLIFRFFSPKICSLHLNFTKFHFHFVLWYMSNCFFRAALIKKSEWLCKALSQSTVKDWIISRGQSPSGSFNMTLWYDNAASVSYLHSELLQTSDILCVVSGPLHDTNLVDHSFRSCKDERQTDLKCSLMRIQTEICVMHRPWICNSWDWERTGCTYFADA